jgi:hypothetical protein
MTDEEILLVMTIVKLITGDTPNVSKVDSAYESAIKSLNLRGRAPKEVKVTSANRPD